MRIVLINPPYLAEERYGKDLAKLGPTSEPLGLAYLAAVLEQDGHEVFIWDAMVTPAIPRITSAISNADLIGVSILTPAYDAAKKIIRFVHSISDAPIVVGGAHVTALPQETLKDILEVDYVVKGEGEESILEVLEAPTMFGEGRIFTNMNILNLDNLPFPARHLLPMDKYKLTASRTQRGHSYTISVARGCPFHCTYCSRINGRKVRFRNMESILTELHYLIGKYDAKEINFEADTFTLKKSFVMNLCTEIIKSGYHKWISWTCESRVDTMDADMLKLMRAAGCWQISYGIESGNQRLLDFMKKGTNLAQIRKTIHLTEAAGIGTRAFFMLGIPTETQYESQQTIDFAKELNAEWTQFTLTVPFPGTEMYEWVQEHEPDRLSPNWSDYQTHAGWKGGPLAYVPRGRTTEEMCKLQRQAYRAVYLRPRSLRRHIKNIRWSTLPKYARGALALLKRS